MLLKFRVANFRSIREEQEFSLMRSSRFERSATDDKDVHASSWYADVSTVAAVYGGNGAGKSNLLLGLRFLSGAVRNSYHRWNPEGGTPVEPYMLDRYHRKHTSEFEIEFRLERVRYKYGFTLDRSKIWREWLYAYPHGRRQTWYERDTSDPDGWYFGRWLSGKNRATADLTRENSLFLSAAAASGHDQLLPLYQALSRRLRFADANNHDRRSHYTFRVLEDNPELSRQISAVLRFADLGIQDVKVRREEQSDEVRQEISRMMTALKSEDEQPDPETLERTLDRLSLVVEFEHSTDDPSETATLAFQNESMGTQSFIALLGPALSALQDADVLTVDEIDTSLHPRLVGELVRLFQSPSTNPKQAQLIFSSHDTSLLSHLATETPVLDRDQVWFVQKEESGCTKLYPLSDFSPRKVENLERGYLQGRYGGVPFIDPRELDPIREPSSPDQ